MSRRERVEEKEWGDAKSRVNFSIIFHGNYAINFKFYLYFME